MGGSSQGKYFERPYLKKTHQKKGLLERLKVQDINSSSSMKKKRKRKEITFPIRIMLLLWTMNMNEVTAVNKYVTESDILCNVTIDLVKKQSGKTSDF
jgi:hypothetical protein